MEGMRVGTFPWHPSRSWPGMGEGGRPACAGHLRAPGKGRPRSTPPRPKCTGGSSPPTRGGGRGGQVHWGRMLDLLSPSGAESPAGLSPWSTGTRSWAPAWPAEGAEEPGAGWGTLLRMQGAGLWGRGVRRNLGVPTPTQMKRCVCVCVLWADTPPDA